MENIYIYSIKYKELKKTKFNYFYQSKLNKLKETKFIQEGNKLIIILNDGNNETIIINEKITKCYQMSENTFILFL